LNTHWVRDPQSFALVSEACPFIGYKLARKETVVEYIGERKEDLPDVGY
jgi:hypothetical protein